MGEQDGEMGLKQAAQSNLQPGCVPRRLGNYLAENNFQSRRHTDI